MTKSKNKKIKIAKGLHLLFIGELFTAFGFLCELRIFYLPLSFISLSAVIGIVINLIGIFKLFRFNKFFLISFCCICFSLAAGIGSAALRFVGSGNDIISTFDSIIEIISKILSMAFTFGIIRGCSKAALGKANTRFANVMSIVNFVGKFIAILFIILESLFFKSNDAVIKAFSLCSMFISIGVEIFFVVYVYRAYSMANASALNLKGSLTHK